MRSTDPAWSFVLSRLYKLTQSEHLDGFQRVEASHIYASATGTERLTSVEEDRIVQLRKIDALGKEFAQDQALKASPQIGGEEDNHDK